MRWSTGLRRSRNGPSHVEPNTANIQHQVQRVKRKERPLAVYLLTFRCRVVCMEQRRQEMLSLASRNRVEGRRRWGVAPSRARGFPRRRSFMCDEYTDAGWRGGVRAVAWRRHDFYPSSKLGWRLFVPPAALSLAAGRTPSPGLASLKGEGSTYRWRLRISRRDFSAGSGCPQGRALIAAGRRTSEGDDNA